MTRFQSWLHRRCHDQEAALTRQIDRVEVEVFRARKQFEDLQAAYQSLTQQFLMNYRPVDFVGHLFEEQEFKDDAERDASFLHPTWEHREGVEETT